MSYKKFMASAVTVVMVATSSLPFASYAEDVTQEEILFTDIKEGKPFYNEVQTLAQEGIIKGYPDGSFKPNQALNRGQVAKLFSRALKLETPNNIEEIIQAYTDIKLGSEFAEAIAAIKANGILSEQEELLFQPGNPLTRDVMATWLVRAFDLQPDDSVEVTLTDLEDISEEHVENVKVLFQNGITTGKEDGSYSPDQAVSRGQFAAFMYRAMYQIETIEPVPNVVVDISEEIKLPELVNVMYKNGQKGQENIIWNLENYDLTQPGSYPITGSIVGSNKKTYTTIVVENQPLAVKEIHTPNLKQIEIQLNHQRYQKAIVENPYYYQLIDSHGERMPIETVEANGTKLVITFKNPLENGENAIFTMKEDIVGEGINKSILFFDQSIPEVEQVEPISLNKVKVIFSEAMDLDTANGQLVTNRNVLASFKLDNGVNKIRSITVKENGKVAFIDFYSTVKLGKHTLTIDNLVQDYAGVNLKSNVTNFSMSFDSTKPKIMAIKNSYPNQVTVLFNKEIKLNDLPSIEKYFHHTNEWIHAKQVVQTNEREITVLFDSKNEIPMESAFVIDQRAIVDLWGNVNETFVEKIHVSNDGNAPVLEKVKMMEEDATESKKIQLAIQFSEPVVLNQAIQTNNYILKDENGTSIPIESIVKDEADIFNQKFIITLDKLYGDFKKSNYTLHMTNIADVYSNKQTISMYPFEAGSEQAPGDFTANVILQGNDLRFIVDFNREMKIEGAYSILDLAKYELSVNGSSILLHTLNSENLKATIRSLDNGTRAELTLSKVGILPDKLDKIFNALKDSIGKANLQNVDLKVAMLEDIRGNRTNSFTNEILLQSQSTFSIGLNGVNAVEPSQIEITFSESIEQLNPADFILFIDKNGNRAVDTNESLTIGNVTYVNDQASSIVTIIPANQLAYNAKYENQPIYLTTTANPKTINRFGQKLEIKTQQVMDKIIPQLQTENGEKKITIKNAADNQKALIVMSFTEEIDPATVSRLTFQLQGGDYPVRSATVNKNVVELTIDLKGGKPADLIGKTLVQQLPITDLNNNLANNIVSETLR